MQDSSLYVLMLHSEFAKRPFCYEVATARELSSAAIMIFLFGDQTFDVIPHIPEIASWQRIPSLASFLLKSHQVIQWHLLNFASDICSARGFRTIDDILEWKAAGNNFVPLDMALVCLYQLGTTLLRSEDIKYGKNTLIVGLCTGSLAATAFSCSQNDSDLIALGMEAISAAFKIGLLVLGKVSEFAKVSSYPSKALSPELWAMVVFGPDPEAALKAFLADIEEPSQKLKPYVSAILPGGATISGVPSSLEQLRSNTNFQGYKFVPIPVFGPYHHDMYADLRFENITKQIPPAIATRCNNRTLLLSKGTRSECQFGRLMAFAIEDILVDKLHTPNLVRGTEEWLAAFEMVSAASPQTSFIETIGITTDHPCYKGLEIACLSGQGRRDSGTEVA